MEVGGSGKAQGSFMAPQTGMIHSFSGVEFRESGDTASATSSASDEPIPIVQRRLSNVTAKFEPTPPDGRSRRRGSLSRPNVESPCTRRIQTGKGRAMDVLNSKREDSMGDMENFMSFTNNKKANFDDGLIATFLNGLEENQKNRLIAGLNDKFVDTNRVLNLYVKYSNCCTMEDLVEVINEAKAMILCRDIRIIEVDTDGNQMTEFLKGTPLDDTCIAEYVCFVNKKVVLNDLEVSLPFIDPQSLEVGVRNIICIPCDVNVTNRMKIIIQFVNKKNESEEDVLQGFSADDVVLAEHIASLVGKMISNLKRSSQVRDQKRCMSLLSKVAVAVCSEIDGPNLIQNLIKVATSFIACGRISLYLCDNSKNEVYCVYATKHGVGERTPYGVGIAGWVAENGQPLNIKDGYKDVRFNPDMDLRQRDRTRSILAVPVMMEKQMLGILQLINKYADEGDPLLDPLPRTAARFCSFSGSGNSFKSKDKTEALSTSPGRANWRISSPMLQVPKSRRSATTIAVQRIEEEEKEDSSGNSNKGQSIVRLPRHSSPVSSAYSRGTQRTEDDRDSFQMDFHPELRLDMEYRKRQPHAALKKPPSACQSESVGLTSFSNFDLRICELIGSRIAQALRVRLVDYQYDKAMADNDASDLLRTMIYKPENKESGAGMRGHKTSFQAIGKFLKVLKNFRLSNELANDVTFGNGRRSSAKMSSSDEEASKVVHKMCEELIRQKPLPDMGLFQQLGMVHEKLMHDVLHVRFGEWHFDVLKYGDTVDLTGCVCSAFTRLGLANKFRVPEDVLMSFVQSVKEKYLNNPYHNWFHAVSVLQQVYSILLLTQASSHLHFQDVFALLIAALCHDVGHRGRTNEFESKTFSQLAVTYNDTSVLEHYHASLTFTILLEKKNNILDGVTTTKFKELRKLIITHILNTDMKFHGELLTNVKSLLIQADKSDHVIIHRDNGNEREMFSSFLLHCCDIGAQTFPSNIASKWADLVLEEFKQQADDEVKLSLPVTPYMQNLGEPAIQANVQIGFISYVVQPTWETLSALVPECSFCLDNIATNREAYERVKRENDGDDGGEEEEKAKG